MERPGLLNEGTERIEFGSGMVIHNNRGVSTIRRFFSAMPQSVAPSPVTARLARHGAGQGERRSRR